MKPTLRLPATLLLAALGTHPMVLADTAVISTMCDSWLTSQCRSVMQWVDPFGNYGTFEANDGCYNDPGPPAMERICFDWKNKHGHFVFHGQPKRCLAELWTRNVWGNQVIAQWEEVKCNW